jgi:ribosome-binding factor A
MIDCIMSTRRVQKVAEAIREVVSMAILTELQDPRVRDVTVTFVEAAADLRSAKVMVSVMGDDTRQNLTLRGLQNAAGFLQAKIAERLDLRYTPRLTFVLDQGVKRSIAVAKILREVLPPETAWPRYSAKSCRRKRPRSRRKGPPAMRPSTWRKTRRPLPMPRPTATRRRRPNGIHSAADNPLSLRQRARVA